MREPRGISVHAGRTGSAASSPTDHRRPESPVIARCATALGAVVPAALMLIFAFSTPAPAEPTFHWVDVYDGGRQSPDQGTAVLCDPEGHAIVGGESADGDGVDMYVQKLARESGETLWERRVSAFDGNDMTLSGMVWDGQENILVGGHINGCVG